MTHIPLAKCVHGSVYRLHSRNLTLGVFEKSCDGFIGIREKFGRKYLSTEYHHDTGKPFGTAKPVEAVAVVPSDGSIILAEDLGLFDSVTERPVAFDKPVDEGGKGWYFADDGKASLEICGYYRFNKPLFDFLEKYSCTP